jgi:hypothetical protein
LGAKNLTDTRWYSSRISALKTNCTLANDDELRALLEPKTLADLPTEAERSLSGIGERACARRAAVSSNGPFGSARLFEEFE